MIRKKEAQQAANNYIGHPYDIDEGHEITLSRIAYEKGIKWADEHPSDETIMLILNCVGYEQKSWVDFVKKELKKRNNYE